jgi:hypothetical protein
MDGISYVTKQAGQVIGPTGEAKPKMVRVLKEVGRCRGSDERFVSDMSQWQG